MRKPRRPVKLPKSENSFQYSCIDQLKLRRLPDVWWHHSPNGAIRPENAIHWYKMGVLSGFWDLTIYKPVWAPQLYRSIDEPHWFELKTGDNELTQQQQEFRGMLFERGAKHKVCRDVDTFVEQCLEWELIK